MSVLVFGAEGIAGRAIMNAFPEFLGTTRRAHSGDFRILSGIDITQPDDLQEAFEWGHPDVVINCAGIVKSECGSFSPERVIAVNGNAPHAIARISAARRARVVHLSTDCVFDGTRGGRHESERPDATDLYGQTKSIGELYQYTHCVTLRTSFIGRDPARGRGLLEWLLSQKGDVPGFTNVMWSGLSALELARVVGKVALDPRCAKMAGVYHVSGPVISKADLLQLLVEAYRLPCRIIRCDDPHVDRTLDGSKFYATTRYSPPSWEHMSKELEQP